MVSHIRLTPVCSVLHLTNKSAQHALKDDSLVIAGHDKLIFMVC